MAQHSGTGLSRSSLKWWQDTVLYELYPKSFLDTKGQGTGTLEGVRRKLGYLEELGVGAVWLTPVYPSPMADNGYDVSDYYGIDPSYGTMEDFDALVEEADRHGIKIAMDLVFNHSSDRNAWFLESRSSRDNPKADFYIWRDPAPDGGCPNNWRSVWGGPAWEWCGERGQYCLHTFSPRQPDLNWENPEVRRALFDVANFWADKGVGGFRLDAITHIKKPEGLPDGRPDSPDGTCNIASVCLNTPGILDFLHEFKREVQSGRDVFTVAEAPGVPHEEIPEWIGEDGVFDMIIEFSHVEAHENGHGLWCDHGAWELPVLTAELTASQLSTQKGGWYPIFFENHDQPRSIENFLPEKPVDEAAAAKMLATVLYTLRGTPLLYQGQELGMGNVAWSSIDAYDDVSSKSQYEAALEAGYSPKEALAGVHRKSRDNARTPMQWDASPNAGFTTGTPWLPVHADHATRNVEAESADPESVLNWYRMLAGVRQNLDVLLVGDYEELLPGDRQIYAFSRTVRAGSELAQGQPRRTMTLANFSNEPASYGASLVAGMRPVVETQGASRPGVLRPLEAVVYAG